MADITLLFSATPRPSGALALIVVLLVVQIWLLMASVESGLAGHQVAL